MTNSISNSRPQHLQWPQLAQYFLPKSLNFTDYNAMTKYYDNFSTLFCELICLLVNYFWNSFKLWRIFSSIFTFFLSPGLLDCWVVGEINTPECCRFLGKHFRCLALGLGVHRSSFSVPSYLSKAWHHLTIFYVRAESKKGDKTRAEREIK